MIYEFYIEEPMQMCELNLNTIIDENPSLKKILQRCVNHPLISKLPLYFNFAINVTLEQM